jgi:hypothetical protein
MHVFSRQALEDVLKADNKDGEEEQLKALNMEESGGESVNLYCKKPKYTTLP